MLRRKFLAALGFLPFVAAKEEKEDGRGHLLLAAPPHDGQWTLCIIVKDGKRTFKWVECVEL